MASLSTPPPPKTRMLLFVAFVLLVALVTFLTLMWLKPFDGQPAAEGKSPAAGEKQAKADEKPPASDEKPAKPQVAEHKPAAAEQKPPAAGQKPPAAEQKPPAAGQKPPVAEQKPPATEQKPPATEQKPPATEQKPPAAEGKPAVAAQLPPELLAPELSQTADGWRLVIRTSAPVQFKHFTLAAPPRLAIDARGAAWAGPGQIETRAPFISRIRLGKQPDAIRLVLDFAGERIPAHRIQQAADRLTVLFPAQ